MSKALYLYSPIEPLKTGTAHYFSLFMEQIKGVDLSEYTTKIVVDRTFYVEAEWQSSYEIIDFRDVQRTPADTTLYFLANNEFHRYVHRALYDHRSAYGIAVSIVHEPSMWMNIEAMCNLREYDFCEEDLEYFGSYEFGEEAPFICDLFERGAVDKNFAFTSLAGTHIYERSDAIVFHSHFARDKFILERSATYRSRRTGEPLYLVMDHPPEKLSRSSTLQPTARKLFVAGTYGWVKRTKQVEALIEGFNTFYQTLPADDREKVALHIVGEIDREPGFDPVQLAGSSVAGDRITFFGYVSDDELNERISQCSILFSLRFPSCGETSGPLRKAQALGVSVVLSDYAAFAEEPADYHISVEHAQQLAQIADILKREFQSFKNHKERKNIPYPAPRPNLAASQVLDKVLVFGDNEACKWVD